MFKIYFLTFLLAHLLGDYYFQSEQLAELKNKNMYKLMQHNCIYLITCIISVIPVFSPIIFLSAFLLSIMHAIIDFFKYFYLKNHTKKSIKGGKIYICDQVLHLICLIIIAYIMTVTKSQLNVLFILNHFFTVINISKIKILSWAVMILFIIKPANVTIKQLLSVYKPGERLDNIDKNDKKAGSLIGSLERLIILILLPMNQLSAIGLVLTAKSIARYNKISEDKNFAEYYLLGTLLSTVLVIICYIIIY